MGPHAAASRPMTLSEQADELEEQMMEELNDKIATKSVLFSAGRRQGRHGERRPAAWRRTRASISSWAPIRGCRRCRRSRRSIDFFKHRFASTNHLLQSATHALKAGLDEKVVLACLLHDIGGGRASSAAITATGARS